MYKILDIDVSDEENALLLKEQANGKILKVVDGKVVAIEQKPTQKELAQMEIQELKSKLSSTDYLVIKLAEGELTLEEYEPMKLQRKKWREAINKLEEEMNNGE